MSEGLANPEGVVIRETVREWARRSAAGELTGLDWVDTDLRPKRSPHKVEVGPDGVERFRHLPYTRFLPGPMAEAMVEAQERGEVSAMEALMMVMARPEWLVLARPLIWSPLSPEPRLLAWILERWGVGAEVHRDDPERISRVAARLPRWRPHRGGLRAAMEMLQDGAGERVQFAVTDQLYGGAVPTKPALRDEAFTCRSDGWWAQRKQPGAKPSYRVEGGALRFQPADGPAFELVREDVLVELVGGLHLSRQLIRLLPVWATVRVVTEQPTGASS